VITANETLYAQWSATGWTQDTDGWRYYSSGVAQTGWLQLGDQRYYLQPSTGLRAEGWLKLDGSWYYFDTDTGAMRTGWLWDGASDCWYYLDAATGVMLIGGWVQLPWSSATSGTDWFYFNPSGSMATGWLYSGNAWYFLDYDSGVMRTGWVKDAGQWYYLASSGAMVTGWQQLPWSGGSDWFYFNSDGSMATGWLQYGGYWYYLQPSGVMAQGWVQDNGTWYYCYGGGNGRMAVGWIDDGSGWYFLSGSGAWLPNVPGGGTSSNSFIEVDISAQKVYFVLNGQVNFSTDCVTGRPDRATPTGTWAIQQKLSPTVLVGPDYRTPVNFWMQVHNGVGLHDATWQPVFGGDWYLKHGSHGCINLPYAAAKYLYDSVWIGLPVIIHQ
jgi:glucan-binding YG repeat protein